MTEKWKSKIFNGKANQTVGCLDSIFRLKKNKISDMHFLYLNALSLHTILNSEVYKFLLF